MKQSIRVRAGGLILQNDAVLLIEYEDENGLHYNIPGGGVEPGESIQEGVKRELLEEASVEVDVGPLAFVYEYAPHLNDFVYGERHGLSLIYACRIRENQTPTLPQTPDPNQTAVKWIPLHQLKEIVLYPNIKEQILQYANGYTAVQMLEECHLPHPTMR